MLTVGDWNHSLYKDGDLDDLRKHLPASLKNASIRLEDSPGQRNPRTFAQKIMEQAKFPGIVLTSSHPEVRCELAAAKVKFFFAHPHKYLEAQVEAKKERLSERQEKEEIEEHKVLLDRVVRPRPQPPERLLLQSVKTCSHHFQVCRCPVRARMLTQNLVVFIEGVLHRAR